MPVPHTLHLPFIAGRPFFMVTFSAFTISRFALHLTQYASSAIVPSFIKMWIRQLYEVLVFEQVIQHIYYTIHPIFRFQH